LGFDPAPRPADDRPAAGQEEHSMRRVLAMVVICAAAASPALADVKLTATIGGKGMGMAGSGESVTYIKGMKMRTDSSMAGRQTASIIDVGAQKMIVLNPGKQEAEVYDMTAMAADMAKNVDMSAAKVSMTPNGQTKQILGRQTTGYDLSITMPMAAGGMNMDIVLSGPAFIAKDAPGGADYAAFYKAAAEKGFFFTAPQQAKANQAQAKSMAEMYRQMAAIGGLPYSSEIQIKFAGSGPMAAMMEKMGGVSMTTTVTAVATDPIPDSTFEVPAGWKVTNK
jgi:hypothetical protein